MPQLAGSRVPSPACRGKSARLLNAAAPAQLVRHAAWSRPAAASLSLGARLAAGADLPVHPAGQVVPIVVLCAGRER